jgi:PAS domain S-box-containing protein
MASPDHIASAEGGSQQEIEFRRIVNLAPQMLAVSEPDGRTSWVNEVVLDYFGISLADLTATDDWRTQFFHPDDLQSVEEYRLSAIARGSPFETEQRIRGKDGKYRWFLIRNQPLKDSEGRVLRWYSAATDIEDRKRAEEAVRRSEKELRDVIDTIPVNAWSALPDGYVDFMNLRTLESAGLPREKVLGWAWGSAVHPEDLPGFVDKWRAALAAGKPMEGEARVRQADGTYHWWLIRDVPLRDEQGKVVKWYGCGIDIEDRKCAEEAVRRTEKNLRDVVATIPTFAWTALPDGSVDFVNRYWLEYSGLSPQETVGSGWQVAVHPEDLEQHSAKWRASVATGEPLENEVRWRRAADGQYRWFLVRGVPLRDERGNILKWYGTGIDIEDRKRAEALLTGEKRILEMVAKGDSLPQILDSLCRLVEGQASGVLTSILLIDGDRLRHGGAPSLPKAYTDAIDGVVIGPSVGSCGTAAYRGEQVIVKDIATDPLWADYREAALPHSLRACWSTPVFSSQDKVMATFAMYYREPRSPSPRDQQIIEQITHLAGVAIERKLTQEALLRSESYLAEAQRLSHTGTFGWSLPNGKGFWSEEMFRIFQYDRTTKPTMELVQQRVHPEDAALVKQAHESAQDFDFEHRLLMPDGSVKYLHVVAHASRGSPGNVEFIGAVTDITATKQAEEKIREQEIEFRQILDAAPQHLAVLGSDGSRLYLNQSGLEFRGLTLEEFQKQDILEFLHPDDSEGFIRERERALSSGSPFEIETRVRTRDGKYRWYLFRYKPLKDRLGRITRWVVPAIDIDDRKRAEERLQLENVALREEIDKASMFEEIVGNSPVLQKVLSRLSKVAPTDSTVLITGETGTGKELVARAIHRRSHRSARAFVSVNCAAIPRDLIASELFGHEKGAFTGATQQRLGRFEMAEGGTIFLDEVGEIPVETQIALLRVLQEHECERVGGTRPIRTDVRVIAATNRDLQAAITASTFRSDLFYRLHVFPIEMPSLRERREDIPLLVEYFIDRYARKAGKSIRGVNKKTLELLQSYPWPGNIRELQNVIERSVIVCESENFTVDESWLTRQPLATEPKNQLDLSEKLAAQEKEMIEAALRDCGGQVFGPSGAAARLGMPRSTLESKIRSLKINKNRFKAAAPSRNN